MLVKEKEQKGLPWQSSGKTLSSQCREHKVQTLARELRYHMLLGTAKKKESKKYTLKINRHNLSVKFFF